MELLTGIGPMSRFDAAATPMSAAFVTTPNLRPYNVLDPAVSLTATNGRNAPGSRLSAGIDFSEPDRIPMALLNRILWKAAKGRHATMPPPIHA
jgi:hypothetical protein